MNLLLLEDDDFVSPGRAILRGRRLQHLHDVQRVNPGDEIRVGHINGLLGRGRIDCLSSQAAEIQVCLDSPPPPGLPLTLIIALPRPKMIKRIVQTCATMGVKELIFINSYRVEKSYWQSPLLSEEKLREQLLLGLQQSVDTLLPKVQQRNRFKPFVEDELPQLCRKRRALVAHPRASATCPQPENAATVLLIGPEGGFIDYEIDKLEAAGCEAIQLGPRILRTETAVPVLLARLFPL